MLICIFFGMLGALAGHAASLGFNEASQ